MKVIKKISWLFLTVLLVFPFANVSAKNNKSAGNKWLLNKSVVVSIDTDANILVVSKDGTNYTVNYSTAKLIRKYNATAAEAEILVGDFLKIFGKIEGANVTAKRVKDLSIQKYNGKFNGTIKSIDSTSKTLVLTTNHRGDQTVNVYDTTKIRLKNQVKSFSDLAVGNKITIKGTWNRTHSIIYNTTWIKMNQQ